MISRENKFYFGLRLWPTFGLQVWRVHFAHLFTGEWRPSNFGTLLSKEVSYVNWHVTWNWLLNYRPVDMKNNNRNTTVFLPSKYIRVQICVNFQTRMWNWCSLKCFVHSTKKIWKVAYTILILF